MRKAICSLVIIFLCSTFLVVAYGETIVTYGGSISEQNFGLQTFLAEHPDVSLAWPDIVYYSTSTFTNALLTREFSCDMFTWTTSQIDWQNIMEKGYCYDLSTSDILMQAVEQMHPHISQQAIHNGHLFAVPSSISFVFLQIEEDTWFEAGLTLEDVPQSFPEFLDFLEKWCDRIEDEPEPAIRIIGGWDSSIYTEASYVSWLTRKLIDEAIMQMQYEGKELHFEDCELLALLERCDSVGKRIYNLESGSGALNLFDETARDVWPTNYAKVVFLRQNDLQPKLIKASVSMWAISSSSNKAELSIELLEKATIAAKQAGLYDTLFLYSDAQAQIDPDYESDLTRWTDEISTVLAQLQNPSLDGENRAKLEEKLISNERALKRTEEHKWILPPEQLADYQVSADKLYFPIPNIFDSTQTSIELERLLNLFSNHQTTAEAFLKELDRLAWMMRHED